jgi:hypothetical protein
MTIEVIYNPTWHIVQMLIFLVCITAVTFIAIVLLCGVRPEDIEGV